MIGHLSKQYKDQFLRELTHGGVTYTRVMALPGASQELIRALRELVVDAASWEELFELSRRYVRAAQDAEDSLAEGLDADVFRMSYTADERSLLQAAVREYISQESDVVRYAPSSAEDAFVTIRTDASEKVEMAERLLRRL